MEVWDIQCAEDLILFLDADQTGVHNWKILFIDFGVYDGLGHK